jgi:hypothetical protein
MPSLAAQRRVVQRQRKKNPDDVHVLVTLLWSEADALEARTASDPAARERRQEARGLLREIAAGAGENAADEVTLQRLAAAELALGDDAAAVALYEQLVTRFGTGARAGQHKMWLAYVQLRSGRSADAAQIAASWDPAADATTPEQAYIVAWVRFRARDWKGARDAIASAARRWTSPVGRAAIERDVQLMLARGGAPVDETVAVITQVSGSDAKKRSTMLFRMHEAYMFAGHYKLAGEIFDRLAEGAIPSDLVFFRFAQSDYAYRQNDPEQAARRASEAWQALVACGDKCPAETRQVIVTRIGELAVRYHTVYATSLDERFAAASKQLYQLYLEIPDRPDADKYRGHLTNLEDHMTSADASASKHEKDVMLGVIVARREALNACYEAVLSAEPALVGTVKLMFEVAHGGTVQGATTEPAAGKEGLAAVGACLADEVKTWTFPARKVPGRTVIVYPIAFKPKGAGAPATQPATPEPPAEGGGEG